MNEIIFLLDSKQADLIAVALGMVRMGSKGKVREMWWFQFETRGFVQVS